MRNLMFTVAYDGTNYHGFQRQKNAHTIQEEIEENLANLVKEPVTIIGASRTDAGVHARGQVFTCKVNCSIPTANFPLALNTELPDDIVILDTKEVDLEFDPRYLVHKKIYTYQIYHSDKPSPFLRDYTYYIYHDLNLEAMREASQYLIGKYDFSSFRASGCVFGTAVREILEIDIIKVKESLIVIMVEGTSFLYKMVRAIAGTLIEVGKGEILPGEMREILEARDRTEAGPTAPASGLFLDRIIYKT